MINLAAVYRSEGNFAEAEAVFLEVYEISKRVQGPEHPIPSFSDENSLLFIKSGKIREPERCSRRSWKSVSV